MRGGHTVVQQQRPIAKRHENTVSAVPRTFGDGVQPEMPVPVVEFELFIESTCNLDGL